MNRSRGVSAVEVLVAVMVAAAIAVPMLTLLFQERDTEERSRFEYAAMLAARDAMYEARMLIAIGGQPGSVKHGAKALKGSPIESLGVGTTFEGSLSVPNYSAEQERITVEVDIEGGSGTIPRLHPAKVTARWLDSELAKTPGQQGRKSAVELHFGVLQPQWVTP